MQRAANVAALLFFGNCRGFAGGLLTRDVPAEATLALRDALLSINAAETNEIHKRQDRLEEQINNG
jgi:hypothetical protein